MDIRQELGGTDAPKLQLQQQDLATASGGTTSEGQFVQPPYKRMRFYFGAVVAVQLVMLFTMASAKAFISMTGTHVQLRTHTVDPSDLFRGDYLTLQYDISSVKTDEPVAAGQTVYVVLRKTTPYATAERAASTRPQLDSQHIALKGKVVAAGSDASIAYGLERAYIQERTGMHYQGNFAADVAIDGFGNSVLCGIHQ